MLLYVLESLGSSPGRRGFMMAVAADGTFNGTIGGGIMEYKLVEKAKADLKNGTVAQMSTMQQFHDKAHGTDQSGMICSGSQRVAFIPLLVKHIVLVRQIQEAIAAKSPVSLVLGSAGADMINEWKSSWKYESESSWNSVESLDLQPVIHIIGGGHVGLALSEQMRLLGFYVHIYDDRPNLSTMEMNEFAHEKHLIDYAEIDMVLAAKSADFVVIMTVGYRTDKLVLSKILMHDFYYLGMLGSEKKIDALMQEMKKEGFPQERLDKVFTPIGLPIFSRTTQEIAVSIAAEIIREKNKNLPTGRTQPI
jgi:xanthine dehydrogenase accessory factor